MIGEVEVMAVVAVVVEKVTMAGLHYDCNERAIPMVSVGKTSPTAL
jgi:hypothetical protein